MGNRLYRNMQMNNTRKGARRRLLWWMLILRMVLYSLMVTMLKKTGVRKMKEPRQPKKLLVGPV
jgi:hypothetical protein